MREEAKPFSLDVLQMHSAIMYDTLIHKHNLTTETAKQYMFENEEELELPSPLQGYFATKEIDGKTMKYFIDSEFHDDLPIRANSCETLLFKDSTRSKSVILRPLECTPYRIRPEQSFGSFREMVDTIAPFQHTRPDMWTLNKILAVIGYAGKTFCGICSLSEFGKSSIYLIIDSITKKSPVFQPRSVPGILTQITGNGNIVFDEVQKPASEVKTCMENFSLQVAGNSPIYINGARKAQGTKQRYDVSQQSITFLYNVWNNYNDPETEFFDNIWSNRKAIDSRFLKLKLEGALTEKFDKDFNIVKTAEDNKMLYVRIAKHLEFVKLVKHANKYNRRWQNYSVLELKGRHKIIYDEITWGIDLYCQSQNQYDDMIKLLDSCMTGYKDMLGVGYTTRSPDNVMRVKEEVICDEQLTLVDSRIAEDAKMTQSQQTEVSTVDMILSLKEYIKEHKTVKMVTLEEQYPDLDIDALVKTMLRNGDIFENCPGEVSWMD